MKSGYGLDLENEAKSLAAARRLATVRNVTVRTSFLGAHAPPPEAEGDKDGYIARVADEMLPAIAALGLADAVDGFCEGLAFSPEQMVRVFEAAKALGLPVKLHADQLSNLHGAALAARYGALSADHLEHLTADGIAAMKAGGVVAVLLPGAYYFLKDKTPPPVQALRDAGVAMAVATDCNPGTSPLTSPLLAMNMGCTLFGLTPEEALAGFTHHAAAALDLAPEAGTLAIGKSADLAVWNIDEPAELAYWLGASPLSQRWLGGTRIN